MFQDKKSIKNKFQVPMFIKSKSIILIFLKSKIQAKKLNKNK